MRGMGTLENRLQSMGALGSQRAGVSGAGADVMGQYMQGAARGMAMTGWGMMAPGLLEKQRQQYGAGQQAQQLTAGSQAQYAGATNQAALQAAGYGATSTLQAQGAADQAAMLQQEQAWQGEMMPYQMLPAMLPYMMPEGITSTAEMPHFPGDPAAEAAAAGGYPAAAEYPGETQQPTIDPATGQDYYPGGTGG